MDYISRFEKLGFGLFVHFGLYSKVGMGEWYLHLNPKANHEKYDKLMNTFKVTKNWAKELVKTAKKAGCKYITLTTRHHDGFSLYDTCGLNDFDAPHSASKRDLIKEFVSACNDGGILPMFYHTLLDWRERSYKEDFAKYIDYLVKSIEILCTNYGKIGGFWFDGMWDKPNENWQEDRIYSTIRKYQPDAMIINNTGLSELGKVGHPEIDSVTFERGKPSFVDNSDKHRAGEMCQVLNDHWGYAENDCNYKSVKELVYDLINCRKYGCNFLLNTGLMGNGTVNPMDDAILGEIGKWVKSNKEFIYDAKPSDIKIENAEVFNGENCVYVLIKDVLMSADPNVQLNVESKNVILPKEFTKAVWLDNGKRAKIKKGQLLVEPYTYGNSLITRILKIDL